MRYLVILLLFFSVSCKSIKKNKQVTQSYNKESYTDESIVAKSISLESLEESLNSTTREILEDSIEETTQTSEVVRVNGEEVLVPVIRTTIRNTRTINEEIIEDSISQNTSVNDEFSESDIKDNSTSLEKQKDVEKESEGINLLSSLFEGIFGAFGKYVLGFIILVSTIIGLWIKIKSLKNTNTEI